MQLYYHGSLPTPCLNNLSKCITLSVIMNHGRQPQHLYISLSGIASQSNDQPIEPFKGIIFSLFQIRYHLKNLEIDIFGDGIVLGCYLHYYRSDRNLNDRKMYVHLTDCFKNKRAFMNAYVVSYNQHHPLIDLMQLCNMFKHLTNLVQQYFDDVFKNIYQIFIVQ